MQSREKLNIGEAVFCRLTCGSVVIGALVSQGEIYTKNGIEQFYQIAIHDNMSFRLVESDIDRIEKFDSMETIQAEKKSYFRELSKKYSFECFDENDEIFSNSVILGKVLYDGIWDKFDADEKANFIDHINLDDADITEALDTLNNKNKTNQKWADKLIKSFNAINKFVDNYKRLEETYPFIKWYYDFLWYWLGIDELLQDSCN